MTGPRRGARSFLVVALLLLASWSAAPHPGLAAPADESPAVRLLRVQRQVELEPGNLQVRLDHAGLLMRASRYAPAADQIELALRSGWDERMPATMPAGLLYGLARLGCGDLASTVRWWSRAARVRRGGGAGGTAGQPIRRTLDRWCTTQPESVLASAYEALDAATRRAGSVPRPTLRAAVGAALVPICTRPVALAKAAQAYRSLPDEDQRLLDSLSRLIRDSTPQAPSAPEAAPGAIRFIESARRAGLIFRHGARPPTVSILQVMGSGVATMDLDGDGQDDLVFADSVPLALTSTPPAGATTLALSTPAGACAHPRLFRAHGDGTFDEVPSIARVDGPLQGTGVLAADLTGSGYEDLVLAGRGEVRFLHNCGDGTFRPWPYPLPTIPPRWWTGIGAGPLRRPDALDVYLCAYIALDPSHVPVPEPHPGEWFPTIATMTPTGFQGEPGMLLANHGPEGFADATPPVIAGGTFKGLGCLVAGLLDGDRADLFLVNDTSGNRLFQPHADGSWSDASARAWINLRHGSMGIDLADFDGDGREDLAISNWWDEGDTLLLQKQSGRFIDAASVGRLLEPTRLEVGWGLAAVDLDGDGRPDLIQVNGHTQHTDFSEHGVYSAFDWPDAQAVQVFRNTGSGEFADVTDGAGLDDLPREGRGLSVLDADGDGRPDFAVSTLGEAPALFLNRTVGGSWLWIDLVGTRSGRQGCGARVSLTEDAAPLRGKGVPVTQVRQAIFHPGYLSSSPPRVIFGRGPRPGPAHLSIRWPSGIEQREPVASGCIRMRIVERDDR